MGTIFGEMFDKLLPLPTNKLKTFNLNAIRRIVKEINQTKSLYLEAGAMEVYCVILKIY